jgi:outer membrane protein TolC
LTRTSLAVLMVLSLAGYSSGQSGELGAPASPLLGGVPSGERSLEALPLSLDQAIARGLQHNLGVVLSGEAVRSARGARRRELSDLLPHVTTHAFETREKINLAAFGFTIPGVPSIVGPFSVFDARVSLTQSVLDLHAIHKAHAEAERLEAAHYSYQDTRERVVLVCASLYLVAVAGNARIETAQAQLDTAEALYGLALDRKKAGVVPGVEVLRAQVQRDTEKQRLIVARNQFAKAKLSLARAIGLPLGQEFVLTDRVPYGELPKLELEEAKRRAYQGRSDWKAAAAQVRAAESARKAAQGEGLPSLDVNADYGTIGPSLSTAQPTFTLLATLHVPVFQGGQVQGKVLVADAALKEQKAELEDLRAQIDYEVQTAFLDLAAASERVKVAEGVVALASEQVQEAKDRFAAGVTGNIEVVQAQEALASATENYISSLYDHNLAKASLAQTLGGVEVSYKAFLRGE